MAGMAQTSQAVDVPGVATIDYSFDVVHVRCFDGQPDGVAHPAQRFA
jgi:hypothetical protein